MSCQGIAGAGLHRVVIAAAAACLAVLALLPAAAAADEAEVLYDPTTVAVIEIDLPQASEEALELDPEGKYQPATLTYKRTDGTPGGVLEVVGPKEVQMRLKGSASFRDLSEKAAFKFKFPEAGKGTGPFLGLRKMTLNNMVEDPSMVHERLAYALHRALGVPASRTGFVYLRINGEAFGVYMNVENYDDVAMAKKLGGFDGDVQHVYEGENGADLEPGLVGSFEVDEGPDDISDLEGLAAAVTDPGTDPWSTAVGARADLEEMTRMWAAEKYSGQLDGYAGGPGPDHPNNYFLATGPDGLFRMLPWGQDETWKEDNHLPFDGEAGLMFEECLADSACGAMYEGALGAVQSAVPLLKLDTLAVCTAQLLAPWQQLEEAEGHRFEYDAGEIADAVAETRAFIAGRPGELADYLGNTAPAEPGPVASCPAKEPEPESDPPPPPPATVTPPKAKLRFVSRKGKWLRVGIVSPGSGSVKLVARAAGRRVCGNRTVVSAGPATVSCRLSRAALDALEEGPLRLKVSVRFLRDGTLVSRQVRLPRL
ncbi:MAG TPA: CotH kinase family protein [Solirubrobacterales bacterium]|nr:CotH kinase family protein [Solirubrobacterales bacterium]